MSGELPEKVTLLGHEMGLAHGRNDVYIGFGGFGFTIERNPVSSHWAVAGLTQENLECHGPERATPQGAAIAFEACIEALARRLPKASRVEVATYDG